MPTKKKLKSHVLKPKNDAFNPNVYEPNIDMRESDHEFWKVRTIPEMLALLEKDKSIGLEARVMAIKESDRTPAMLEMGRDEFLKSVNSDRIKSVKLREFDSFNDSGGGQGGFVGGYSSANNGLVGSDYVPLLGGPFNKQQYIHDYLQAQSQAFFAYHHDPIARMIVNTMRDFTLGRSFRVDSRGKDAKAAEVVWKGTEMVNNLQDMVGQATLELGLYGELMVWELPNGQSKIEYKDPVGQESAPAVFPRFRLIDPSVIWDIITYPEDITRVLSYQWVAPTQYQIYTRDNATNTRVPSLKFIYQQIPASQVDHWKVNVVSNEKRGRGDLYPILGYLKRLRDIVNWAMISEQKQAAWSIDTEIDGNQEDIDAYADSQAQLGTIPPAGSEFIHSSKVKREYLDNKGGSSKVSPAWDWCANMIAASTIPMNYWGTSSSHGSSRASSMVATEPVAKRFEMRRRVIENVIKRMYERTMEKFDLESTCEITFPEIVVQDRSAKLADLQLAQQNHWISQQRAAEMASKEFDISEYDYTQEMADIKSEGALDVIAAAPLTQPSLTTPGTKDSASENPMGGETMPKSAMSQHAAGGANVPSAAKPTQTTGDQKRSLRLGRGA